MLKSVKWGIGVVAFLLLIYFSVLSLVSGWSFMLGQFREFWYYIVTLTVGFGVQVGLYSYLRSVIHRQSNTGVVAVSGATSTMAMVSCCAHYLANILPVIGISGMIALMGQYQIELFWIGLAANAVGIVYMGGG